MKRTDNVLPEKKSYIIVSDENRWLSILYNVTKEELEEEIEMVKETHPEYISYEMYVYEINPIHLTYKL